MENNRKIIKLFTVTVLLVGITVCSLAVYNFPLGKADGALAIISIITIFFGSLLQIQLPRTKIHITISDALVFLSLLLYGVETAVLLAAAESIVTSLSFRRKKISIKPETIALNGAFAAVATYLSGWAANQLFSSIEHITQTGELAVFAAMLVIITISQFLVNSLLVTVFTALKTDKPYWQVWEKYCLNAFVLFVFNGISAGLMITALHRVNGALLLLSIFITAVVYITYRRYVNDIKETSAKAEQAERERAEQAEKHVSELQHHILEQEKTELALRESREKFRHAAYHDALTDLPNRNKFVEILQRQIEKNRRNTDYEFAVLFLDLNRFKTINDSLGHSIGDELIFHVGRRLSNLLKESDLVARFSSDEFAVILSNLKDKKDATEFAKTVCQKLSLPFTISGRQIYTSVSVGIAFGNGIYKKAEEILRDADIAMYHAKEKRRSYEIFDQSMHARAVTLLQLETDLRHSLERDEMIVHYQPIIDLGTMMPMGFEALMRWRHPQRGIIPPNEFIPVAEDTGAIIPLTLWILRTACKQAVEWNKYAPANKPLIMSVNLSGKHFSQPDLVNQVRTIIDETGINPRCVKLELTESAVMENAENAIGMFKELRNLGVQLSIDDFGTGYSSLSYLHRFPIDMLKVDRSFVSTMEGGSENGEIVRTVIALAKTLRLNVIAEGIESIHQLHQLRILGCEYGQGYLFSRPVPSGEAEILLQDKNRWQHIIPDNNPAVLAQNREFTHLRLEN